MSATPVRVWINPDEYPARLATVPLDKVPVGYTRGHLDSFGECYADPKVVTPLARHDPFPEVVRDAVQRIARVLEDVVPVTEKAWEDEFRANRDPWTELACYERVADGLELFAAHLTGADEQTHAMRVDLFNLLLEFTEREPMPQGARLGSFGTVTANSVREIGAWMFSAPTQETFYARTRQHRDAILPDTLAGPKRVPIDALFGDGQGPNTSALFRPQELLASADVILGVDVSSGREIPVYRRVFPEQPETGSGAPQRPALRVELDLDSDDVEKLVSVVELAKGWYDSPAR